MVFQIENTNLDLVHTNAGFVWEQTLSLSLVLKKVHTPAGNYKMDSDLTSGFNSYCLHTSYFMWI